MRASVLSEHRRLRRLVGRLSAEASDLRQQLAEAQAAVAYLDHLLTQERRRREACGRLAAAALAGSLPVHPSGLPETECPPPLRDPEGP